MTITVKTRADVGDGIKKGLNRANQALETKNYNYACKILREMLLVEPGLNEARFQLRQAQLEKIGFSVSFTRRLVAMATTAFSIYIKGPSLLRKGEIAKALDLAENAMEADPTLLGTLMFLRQAARAAELYEIAVNTMEIAVRFNPGNTAALRGLAQDYQDAGEANKAVPIMQKVCEKYPNNLNVINELKHATALAAMEKGGWEDAESYKDLMKDKDKAETLEQEDRLVVRDPDTRRKLIEKTRESIKETPDSPGLYKKLASLLQQNHNFDEAIEAYQKVMELNNTFDPGIDTEISECIRNKHNEMIRRAQEAGESEEKITELTDQRDAILLQRLQHRVEKFPSDLNFRFELGNFHWQLGHVDDALQQFQQSQRASHLARKSQVFMGKCFIKKGVYDLAIEQLEQAATEKDRMSANEYKDILYHTGLAYEKKGDQENAFRKFKELYSLDVQYMDIGERIQKFYSQPPADQ